MSTNIRVRLAEISTQLKALAESVNDESLKNKVEGVYNSTLDLLEMLNNSGELNNELRGGGLPLTLDDELVERAFKHVDYNLQNPSYSVEQLSRDMNMDRTGLYRKLVALTGHAPTMFIRSIRLKKAVMLLNLKRFSQAEIAEKVGFSNAAYFSKCFKEEYGVSPSHYEAD